MSRNRCTTHHVHACDECGQPFDCYSEWLRGDNGDGRPAPHRRCSVDLAICEDCANERTKDAHDYACERAESAHHSANC